MQTTTGKQLRIYFVLITTTLFFLASPNPSQAIDLNMTFNSGASTSPSFDSSGSKLVAMMAAVETYYEDIFTADWTLNVEFYYDDLDSGTLANHRNLATSSGKPTSCRIRVNDSSNWFIDSTPFDNSEYDVSQKFAGSLSSPGDYYNGTVPDFLEYSYRGYSSGSEGFLHRFEQDMWSVLLHEMGHGLGMTANVASGETSDYEYDFDPDLVWGNTMAAKCAATDNRYHLKSQSMMNPTNNMGYRTLPSATDIFAIETAANWGDTTIRPKRVEFYSADANADMNDGNCWSGNLWPDYDQDAWIRDGGMGTLTSHNIGTNYLYIGNDSTACTGGYRLRSDHDTVLGDSDGYGKVIINNGGEFQVDWTLTVNSGSKIQMESGSLLDVDSCNLKSGSTLTGAGTIDVEDGFTNNGTITTSGGELVINSLVNVNLDGASPNDGEGRVNVTGGNFTCNKTLTETFSGQMRINSGYAATFTEGWRINGSLDFNGGTSSDTRAKVAGGLFKIAGTVDVDKQCEFDCDSLFQASTVTLANSDDNLHFASGAEATISSDASFSGAGRLYGLTGSSIVLQDGATIDVRFRAHGDLTVEEGGIGHATCNSAFALSTDSELFMEASGDGVCDTIDSNTLTTYLRGILHFDFINGYTPEPGDSFTIVTYDILNGEFASIDCDCGGFNLIADYSSTALTLTVGYIPGDANMDGTVDGSDATILANYWQHGVGMTNPNATWSMGDFNGDGMVDGSDATLLASHWQQSNNPPASVPEPSTFCGLLALLLAGLVKARRRL